MKTEDLKELEKENLEKLIVFASRGIKKKINKLIETNQYNVTFEEYLTIVNILNFKKIQKKLPKSRKTCYNVEEVLYFIKCLVIYYWNIINKGDNIWIN